MADPLIVAENLSRRFSTGGGLIARVSLPKADLETKRNELSK